MPGYDDYMQALPPVTYQGRRSEFQREAIAHTLDATRVPLEHISSLSAIHTGSNQVPQTAGAIYQHNDGSMHVPGNPDAAWKSGPLRMKAARTLAHETGHRYSHVANPVQFSQYLTHPMGRGLLEASAENYADQAVPGGYSGYDYLVTHGKQSFDGNSYKTQRGQRFGNIDPRLR